MIFRITDQCLHTDLTLLVALKLQSTTRRQTLYRFSRYRLFNFYLLLLYLVISLKLVNELLPLHSCGRCYMSKRLSLYKAVPCNSPRSSCHKQLQKGGVPATPSGTATLLRLSPSHQFCPRTLLPVTYFRHPRLPWLDGRCVQGPGTYSPRHG